MADDISSEAYPGELAVLRLDNQKLRRERDTLAVLVFNNVTEYSDHDAAKSTIKVMQAVELPREELAGALAEHDRRFWLGLPLEDREDQNAKVDFMADALSRDELRKILEEHKDKPTEPTP